jgi:hypothetical protein
MNYSYQVCVLCCCKHQILFLCWDFNEIYRLWYVYNRSVVYQVSSESVKSIKVYLGP